MKNKKKNNLVSFESVLVSGIPQCKQASCGIRAGSIKRSKKVPLKENVDRFLGNYLNEFKIQTSRDYLKSHVYKGRRRPLSVSYEVQGVPLQVAFYNFLPSLEDSLNNSPRFRGRSIVKENKFLHKFFEKTPKNRTVDGFSKSITVKKAMKCSSSLQKGFSQEQEMIDDGSNKEIIPRCEVSEDEESPVKEYSRILKPRFNG
jgi:hypothetical protein